MDINHVGQWVRYLSCCPLDINIMDVTQCNCISWISTMIWVTYLWCLSVGWSVSHIYLKRAGSYISIFILVFNLVILYVIILTSFCNSYQGEILRIYMIFQILCVWKMPLCMVVSLPYFVSIWTAIVFKEAKF